MFLFIDALVLGLLVALARSGWRRGFTLHATDLIGFTLAVLAAIRFSGPLSRPFRWVGLSPGWALLGGALAVFVPLIVAVAILGGKAGRVAMKPGLRTTDRFLGVGFGAAWAAGVLIFALLVTQFAPVPLGLADAVRRSPTSKVLLAAGAPIARVLQPVAERDAEKFVLYLRQSLRFRNTEEPETEDRPPLRFEAVGAEQLRPDRGAEQEFLRLVNEERSRRGLRTLRWDERLARVGRAHSEDMYLRGYFAHRALDGSTPGERMQESGIEFLVSGENLALAPTVPLGHDGLMRSPGHRRNILDPDFSRLGVGILVGPKGFMVTQQFCGGC